MRKAIASVLALSISNGCLSSTGTATGASTEGDDDGCRVGYQPVFSGHGNDLVCAEIPMWPPARTGSRDVAAPGCEIADGSYAVTWSTDGDATGRPLFTYMKEIRIEGETLVEVDVGYTSTWSSPIITLYTSHLDWTNASSANVWAAGDTDTWEFVIWRDCVDGLLHGFRTVNYRYPNPGGPQTESWRLTGTR